MNLSCALYDRTSSLALLGRLSPGGGIVSSALQAQEAGTLSRGNASGWGEN